MYSDIYFPKLPTLRLLIISEVIIDGSLHHEENACGKPHA